MLAEALPAGGEDAAGPGTFGQPAFLFSGLLRPWTRAGSHRFPGDPSHASAMILDPGRAGAISPLTISSTPPPGLEHRRPQRVENLGADSQGFSIRRLRFTTALPPPMQDWLPVGGLSLYREGVEPSGSLRKVSSHITIPLPRSYPVAVQIFPNNSLAVLWDFNDLQ